MESKYCVFDHVQQIFAKHPVTFYPNFQVGVFEDAVRYFKEYDDYWRWMLPDGCIDSIVDVETVCSHRERVSLT